jgi:hypothetical protein
MGKAARQKWSEAEIALLLALREAGDSWPAIREALVTAGFPSRELGGICSKFFNLVARGKIAGLGNDVIRFASPPRAPGERAPQAVKGHLPAVSRPFAPAVVARAGAELARLPDGVRRHPASAHACCLAEFIAVMGRTWPEVRPEPSDRLLAVVITPGFATAYSGCGSPAAMCAEGEE